MKRIGSRIFFLIAFPVTLGLAEEISSNDLKTADNSVDNKKNEEARSSVAVSVEATSDTSETSRLWKGNLKEVDAPLNNLGHVSPGQIVDQLLPLDKKRFSDQNEYKYDPNVKNANQILAYNGVPDSKNLATNQVLVSGSGNQGRDNPRSGAPSDDEEDLGEVESQQAFSRLIPYNERVSLHKIPGANNIVTCSREGELHNFWSPSYQCLVCACIRDYGVLRAVCASCAGCMAPQPVTTSTPLVPVTIYTPTPSWEEEVTCKPLPSGQPFENPLHPCQVCICIESTNAYGKPDVQITCQENPQCVLPTDVTVLPPIPDVPVPSPICDKFPLNVLFPHPSDSCKTCRCSVQMTPFGVTEKHLTCLPNPDCTPIPVPVPSPVTDVPFPSSICDQFPINVLFQHPSDSCKTCRCSVQMTPFGVTEKHLTCMPNPDCSPIPDVPVTSPLCDKFPLNVLFPHPSDSCLTCRCSVQMTEFGVSEKHLSCLPNPYCTPDIITVQPDIIPDTAPPEPDNIVTLTPWTPVTVAPPHPGPLPGPSPHDSCRPYIPNQPFQHPWDDCQMCVCTEAFAQTHVTIEINCFSKKSCCIDPPFDVVTPATLPYNPSGKLEFTDAICEYKTFGVEFVHPKDPCNICTCELQGRLITPLCKRSSKPECSINYNAGSSPPSQNKATDAFVPYQNQYGSSGHQIGSSQSSADQQANYNKRKGLLVSQNLQPGNSQYYGSQSMGYPQYNYGQQGYQDKPGAYAQNDYPGAGHYNQAPRHPGYQGQAQALAQSQASASANTGLLGNPYAYAPGYQYPGQGLVYPVNNGAQIRQFTQNSASAQSSAQSSAISATKSRGRSGNPDDNEPADEEN